MINLEQRAPVDSVSEALEAGRREVASRLASIDPESIAELARSTARSALPDDLFQPRRQRWPFVAISLVVAAAIAALFLLRRPIMLATSHAPASDLPSVGPGTLAHEGEASWVETR